MTPGKVHLPDEVRAVLEGAARRHRRIGAPGQRPANDEPSLKSLIADLDSILILKRHGLLPLPQYLYEHYFRPAPLVLRRKEPPAPGAGGCGPAPDVRAEAERVARLVAAHPAAFREALGGVLSEFLAAELPGALDILLRMRGRA